MQTAEMLLHQALVKPGITAEIRHTDGTGIPIHAGGYLGELGANRFLEEISLTLTVDREGFPSNIKGADVFQIDNDRNILDIVREQQEDGKTRFNDLIDVACVGVKKGGQKKFRTNPYNAFMVATYDDTGKVVVTVVTVIVQGDVRFYLASQTTRELQVYRDARGVVTTPDLIGEHCRWDDLEERIVEVYEGCEKKLPSLNDHQPVKHDGSDLPDNNHLRVIWSSLRRQMSAGVRKDGKTVRLSWSQVEAKNITDQENRVSYPGLKFLRQGEVVKVGDYVRTQDPRSEIKIEAQSIQHTQ